MKLAACPGCLHRFLLQLPAGLALADAYCPLCEVAGLVEVAALDRRPVPRRDPPHAGRGPRRRPRPDNSDKSTP